MESDSVVVVFYSRFSEKSTRFLQKIRAIDYRKVCVDHDEIRTHILEDTEKYGIRTVPAVLVFFASGVVKKYENEEAFRWADGISRSFAVPERVPVVPREEMSPPPPPMVTQPSDPSDGMRRRIETTPLIQKTTVVDEERKDENGVEKKMSRKNESIKSLAQQLQAQREKEDEQMNPNAVTKLKEQPV
ncbi:hypothetical protein EBZ80_02400 [bacterium]|nr:hypothetical protein [bacterium]